MMAQEYGGGIKCLVYTVFGGIGGRSGLGVWTVQQMQPSCQEWAANLVSLLAAAPSSRITAALNPNHRGLKKKSGEVLTTMATQWRRNTGFRGDRLHTPALLHTLNSQTCCSVVGVLWWTCVCVCVCVCVSGSGGYPYIMTSGV
ncbi:hypothetical protein E2C01_092818 [Portunus trituberculatus]|uniref:Uncharacterized protein n=1 Tax=Portunus trituberculatus TaxID=210409 RepID=A0A5B7JL89_PORTR|nr:hypothetical protein [Portunus trituberculatus]